MRPLFGIDLGGTKIEGVVLPEPGSVNPLARVRIPTESHLGYKHILNQVDRVIKILESETVLKAEKFGIGTPGAHDPATGRHKNSNTTCLNGMPFLHDLKALTGLELAMANDANCFALAEATLGSVKENMPNARMVFGVIMGTGVGGGLVLDGKVWNGAQGIGGEWGHNFLDLSGGPCYCGKTGCLENVISGPALEKFYFSLSNQALDLKTIVSRYLDETDPFASQTINRLLHFFGKGISALVNILDPDAIVLGGGVGNIDVLYTHGMEEVAKHIFNNRLGTKFFRPSLGDSAGVFGAAMLVA